MPIRVKDFVEGIRDGTITQQTRIATAEEKKKTGCCGKKVKKGPAPAPTTKPTLKVES